MRMGLSHLRICKHRQLKYEEVWLGIGFSSTLGFRNKRAMCVRAWSKTFLYAFRRIVLYDAQIWFVQFSREKRACVPQWGARCAMVRLKPWFHCHIPGWNCSFWGKPCVQSRCNALSFKISDVHAATHILKFYHAASKRSEQFLKGPCVWKCVPISWWLSIKQIRFHFAKTV